MTVNSRFEELYSQIELVRGAGDRQGARLCIMSFVAFLAGEAHSDNPVTASPVIRRFAITINDEMPATFRQGLKCFAPQMIGTRDGHDNARARLLLDAARSELLPHIEIDFDDVDRTEQFGERKRTAKSWLDARRHVQSLVTGMETVGDAKAQEQIAFVVAHLVCGCGQSAPSPATRLWYWAKAVDLLDRLSTIGIEDERPTISEDQVNALSGFLADRQRMFGRRTRAANLWTRVRGLLPTLA